MAIDDMLRERAQDLRAQAKELQEISEQKRFARRRGAGEAVAARERKYAAEELEQMAGRVEQALAEADRRYG